jgi:hypothetical protein
MFVQYKPKGEPEQSWDFDPEDVRQSEAEVVEKRYGANWDDFLNAVRAGNAKARRVLLWHLTRRTHHNLRYEDTPDFRMGELLVEFSSKEIGHLLREIEKMDSSISEEDRQMMVSRLNADYTEAVLRERGGQDDGADILPEVEAGKAS